MKSYSLYFRTDGKRLVNFHPDPFNSYNCNALESINRRAKEECNGRNRASVTPVMNIGNRSSEDVVESDADANNGQHIGSHRHRREILEISDPVEEDHRYEDQ